MERKKITAKINAFRAGLIWLGLGFYFTSVQSAPVWDPLRAMQPVVISADSVPELLGARVNQIFAYRYSQLSNQWTQIPFQIDEKGPEIVQNFYDSTRIDTFISYFGQKDGSFNSGEEILFLVKDAGDQAPDNRWIPNPQSRDYSRSEIQIVDPLAPTQVGYVYLYRSPSLTLDPNLADYVVLTPPTTDTTGNDIIDGLSYTEGHDSNGFTTDWRIPWSQQGTNTDILDLLKIRLRVEFGFIVRIMETGALKFRKLDYLDGRVRLVRRLNYFLVFALFTEPVGIADFTSYYFPYHTNVLGPTKRLDASWGVAYLRQSFDLNEQAVGMYFYNPYNARILIDGVPDAPVDYSLPGPPTINWHLVTGAPGSILFTYTLPNLGTAQQLYYCDDTQVASNDGFSYDSGDGKSYGDIGISISGNRMEGSFGMSYNALFLPPNQDPTVGPAYLAHQLAPLRYATKRIVYDRIAPGAIVDLQVTHFTTSSITLGWTAPGDDGLVGGAVARYELKYDAFPVDELNEWWQLAIPVTNAPVPAPAGTQQSFTLTGLRAQQQYFFVMRSQDDMGSWSALSNIASGVAYPVELMRFELQQHARQIVLQWVTASETNNHGFEVEKKITRDQIEGPWQMIGFVKGQGTTAQPTHYNFIDPTPAYGTLAYRLKQIDRDGRFIYSLVQTIEVAIPQNFALLQNYPNPFNPVTTIEVQIAAAGAGADMIWLRIFNTLGTAVRAYDLRALAPGVHVISWDGTDSAGQPVAAGVYFYQLTTPGFNRTRKMLRLP
ncbi:T9SS type A sorting domain-containing protein [candidate division KSB1 bacterium]|nr:T9SS type A sorting domain-containing protein [candidate division KSB1 bacterium]